MKKLYKICILCAAVTMLCSCEFLEMVAKNLSPSWYEDDPITITLNSERYNWDNLTWTDYKYESHRQSFLDNEFSKFIRNPDYCAWMKDRNFFLPDNIVFTLQFELLRTTEERFAQGVKYTTEEIITINGEEKPRFSAHISLFDLETGEKEDLDHETTGCIEFSSDPSEGFTGVLFITVLDGDETILTLEGMF